ncbi:2-hydroxychromene-2-carboxylate isomerase [Motiliproteus sediminis]|uniref:2-hydroxychromene-2-carboxylate isomerase n=1 Tax=Motiliproteus sediminis TaxID=1468178 RepID=UPI001AEFCA84|nr:2-hydroxychromene-2-carboxylate isomerase [Motiliproteus sediminis]
MSACLHFYFDFLSPYAYFSWRRLQPLCDRYGAELRAHPVVFGKLLDHWGQRGPAEVPPKKALLYRYCYRYAARQGFAFNPPSCHPFNPLPTLRLALAEVSGTQQFAVIDSLFEAGWSQGADLSCSDSLKAILDHAGLDGSALLGAACSDNAKAALRRETEQAIARGVFGVPAFVLDDELFWGNDQLDHIELCLRGDDPLDRAAIDEMLARPRGIDRKAISG